MEDIVQVWKPEPDSDLALKPCPFCGNEEIMYMQYQHVAGLRWMVMCSKCVASIDPGYAQERHRVAQMWNRRAGENE